MSPRPRPATSHRAFTFQTPAAGAAPRHEEGGSRVQLLVLPVPILGPPAPCPAGPVPAPFPRCRAEARGLPGRAPRSPRGWAGCGTSRMWMGATGTHPPTHPASHPASQAFRTPEPPGAQGKGAPTSGGPPFLLLPAVPEPCPLHPAPGSTGAPKSLSGIVQLGGTGVQRARPPAGPQRLPVHPSSAPSPGGSGGAGTPGSRCPRRGEPGAPRGHRGDRGRRSHRFQPCSPRFPPVPPRAARSHPRCPPRPQLEAATVPSRCSLGSPHRPLPVFHSVPPPMSPRCPLGHAPRVPHSLARFALPVPPRSRSVPCKTLREVAARGRSPPDCRCPRCPPVSPGGTHLRRRRGGRGRPAAAAAARRRGSPRPRSWCSARAAAHGPAAAAPGKFAEPEPPPPAAPGLRLAIPIPVPAPGEGAPRAPAAPARSRRPGPGQTPPPTLVQPPGAPGMSRPGFPLPSSRAPGITTVHPPGAPGTPRSSSPSPGPAGAPSPLPGGLRPHFHPPEQQEPRTPPTIPISERPVLVPRGLPSPGVPLRSRGPGVA